jgi:hypothetical protein
MECINSVVPFDTPQTRDLAQHMVSLQCWSGFIYHVVLLQLHLSRSLSNPWAGCYRYMPLNFTLGPWPYSTSDTLICQLWECDSGCSPSVSAALPNATAGDDYLGQATLAMAAFKVDPALFYLLFSRTV